MNASIQKAVFIANVKKVFKWSMIIYAKKSTNVILIMVDVAMSA